MLILRKFVQNLMFIFLFSTISYGQNKILTFHWADEDYSEISQNNWQLFPDAHYNSYGKISYGFFIEKPKGKELININGKIIDFNILKKKEQQILPFSEKFEIEFTPTNKLGKEGYNIIVPSIIKNKKIKQVQLSYTFKESTNSHQLKQKQSTAINSILATGNWYKLEANQQGVYKIKGSDLAAAGININTINPAKIKIAGYQIGMLPEPIHISRPNDIPEIPIVVNDGGDQSFDANDYILFYSNGLDRWYNDISMKTYFHLKHLYDTKAYFYLSFDGEDGKRVQQQNYSNETKKFTTYDYLWFNEEDIYNLKSVGRWWYGHKFDHNPEHTITLNGSDRDISQPINYRIAALGNGTNSTSLEFIANGTSIDNLPFSGLNNTQQTAGFRKINKGEFSNSSQNLTFKFKHKNNGNSAAFAHLDYLTINYKKHLKFSTGNTLFLQKKYEKEETVDYNTFNLKFISISGSPTVWDVTNPVEMHQEEIVNNEFTAHNLNGKIGKYVVFDPSSARSVSNIHAIDNQNLHAIKDVDYLIIYPKAFQEQATTLANHRQTFNNYQVATVLVDDIYNEFSSGTKDITAIRDFIKMVRENSLAGSNNLKNILLFGDATYDPKNLEGGAVDLIPTWESTSGLSVSNSVATDDYFVLLDNNDANNVNSGGSYIDVGIGRLVINTKEEAIDAVRKIIHYDKFEIHDVWNNTITMVADDVDQGEAWERGLAEQANHEIDIYSKKNPEYYIKKIYADAYNQVNSVGGQRYPEVESDISKAINNGTLIMHYYGHGGEKGWGSERFLSNEDILSWNNMDKLTLFVTTTCEFTRYDDKNRVSAGEFVFLNKNGGGIALITSTRTLNIADAQTISRAVYQVLESEKNNHKLTLGELYMLMKNDLINVNKRRLILVGDPGTILKKPEFDLEITKLNGVDINNAPDTLSALSKITLEGQLVSNGSNLLVKDGIADIQVLDKKQLQKTLNNDQVTLGGNLLAPVEFETQNNRIFKGKVPLKDGKFKVTFIVPKDIKYDIGDGKILLYAKGDDFDASGSEDGVQIGGINPSPEEDDEGPLISLFMNDTTFVDGGLVPKKSSIYARISDDHGLNIVGSGVGHDLKAIVDENSATPLILNNFFEFFPGSYQKGEVTFPLDELEPGNHTLSLKAWDTYNNSSIAKIDFHVVENINELIDQVSNYPNPFSDVTFFSFQHNLYDRDIRVDIEIYNSIGQHVHTISKEFLQASNTISDIEWNTSTGQNVSASGIYFYRLVVEDIVSGEKAVAKEKLVIIK
jgi:hypothetical protein